MPFTRRRRRQVVTAAGGGSSIIASDNYTRANQDPISGNTPVGAKPYTGYVITGMFTGAGMKIASNTLVAKDAGVDGITIDAGISDFKALVTFTGDPTSLGLTFRISDASNGFYAFWNGSELVVRRVVANAATGINNINSVSFAAGDSLEVILAADVLTFKKGENGTVIDTITDSFNQTAQSTGPLSFGTTAGGFSFFKAYT